MRLRELSETDHEERAIGHHQSLSNGTSYLLIMRKLLILWNYVEWGGAQIYFIGIIKLARATWDVTVILPRASHANLLGFLDREGIRYEFLEHHSDLQSAPTIRRKVERRWRNMVSEIEVYRYLRRFDLRNCILHIEAAPWQSGILLTALAARGANIFVTFHNALPEAGAIRELLWKIRIGLVSRLPRWHVFTSNQNTKDQFRRWFSEAFWRTIKVTYTTVNPPEINSVLDSGPSRAELRSQLGIGSQRFVVVCLGQFIDRKGRWDFLEAAKLVCAERDDIDFLWMTSSPLTRIEEERIRSYALNGRFELVPSDRFGKEREDVLSFYKIADVYALPSHIEGLPIALLEAMAMGVPSISTNVYAIPEAVRHDETGLLIEPRRPEQLAEAIMRLYSDGDLRARIGSRGRHYVLTNFDERVASQIAIDAYEDCFADV